MKKTLQQHLIKVFVGLTICPLLLVSVFFSYLSLEFVKGEALKHEQVVAKRISAEVNLFIGGLSKELHVVADDLNFSSKGLVQKKQIIGSLISHGNLFNQIAVLNTRGDEELRISLTDIVNDSELRNRKNNGPGKTCLLFFGLGYDYLGKKLIN